MKRLYMLTAILFAVLTVTASCQDLDFTSKAFDAAFTLDAEQVLIPGASPQRVLLTLSVKGNDNEAYVIEYAIDGKVGNGVNALTIYDNAVPETGLYSFGEVYMPAGMYTDDYEGNFPTGSATKLRTVNTGKSTCPSLGKTKFLSPKLNAGIHTIEYTVSSSHGQSVKKAMSFTLPDKAAM